MIFVWFVHFSRMVRRKFICTCSTLNWNRHFTICIRWHPLTMVGIPWVGSSSKLHYLFFSSNDNICSFNYECWPVICLSGYFYTNTGENLLTIIWTKYFVNKIHIRALMINLLVITTTNVHVLKCTLSNTTH